VGLRTGGGPGSSQTRGWTGTASLHLLEDPWFTADGKGGEEQHSLHNMVLLEGGRDVFHGAAEVRVWTNV